jgi:hypothetical protein
LKEDFYPVKEDFYPGNTRSLDRLTCRSRAVRTTTAVGPRRSAAIDQRHAGRLIATTVISPNLMGSSTCAGPALRVTRARRAAARVGAGP